MLLILGLLFFVGAVAIVGQALTLPPRPRALAAEGEGRPCRPPPEPEADGRDGGAPPPHRGPGPARLAARFPVGEGDARDRRDRLRPSARGGLGPVALPR